MWIWFFWFLSIPGFAPFNLPFLRFSHYSSDWTSLINSMPRSIRSLKPSSLLFFVSWHIVSIYFPVVACAPLYPDTNVTISLAPAHTPARRPAFSQPASRSPNRNDYSQWSFDTRHDLQKQLKRHVPFSNHFSSVSHLSYTITSSSLSRLVPRAGNHRTLIPDHLIDTIYFQVVPRSILSTNITLHLSHISSFCQFTQAPLISYIFLSYSPFMNSPIYIQCDLYLKVQPQAPRLIHISSDTYLQNDTNICSPYCFILTSIFLF